MGAERVERPAIRGGTEVAEGPFAGGSRHCAAGDLDPEGGDVAIIIRKEVDEPRIVGPDRAVRPAVETHEEVPASAGHEVEEAEGVVGQLSGSGFAVAHGHSVPAVGANPLPESW